MNSHEHSYDKYLVENDQFFYDEKSSKKGAFLKQDSELYNEEEAAIPGASVRVQRISNSPIEDWQILINGEKGLLLKGSRFTAKERDFLRTAEGLLFVIDGTKKGWSSVSEFKRQLQSKGIK